VACERGHCEVAELLLAHETDMEAKDVTGNTPLHVASQHQQTRLVQILLEAGADPDSENSVSHILLVNCFRISSSQ
jgi:ankyrin repeat protein